MKISVIIPVFNQAQYLPDAIESVLAQTYKAHEIIVIDDGSPDNSAEIASKYPVRLIRQDNKGLASARNTGLMNMTGDYFYPLDADDMMLEKCLERVSQEDADIISPSFKEFGMSSREVVLMENPTLEHFKVANMIGYFSAFRKSALLSVGGYNPKMTFGWEDWDLTIGLLKRGFKLKTIPDILLLYRTKESSMYRDSLEHSDFLKNQMRINHSDIYGESR